MGIRKRAGEAAEALNGEIKVRKNAQKSISVHFLVGRFLAIHPKFDKPDEIVPEWGSPPTGANEKVWYFFHLYRGIFLPGKGVRG